MRIDSSYMRMSLSNVRNPNNVRSVNYIYIERETMERMMFTFIMV